MESDVPTSLVTQLRKPPASKPPVRLSAALMGSLAKGFCRSFCGNLAEICKSSFHCVRKECGNSAESLWKFRGNFQTSFCNDPVLNDPMRELLIDTAWVFGLFPDLFRFCSGNAWPYSGHLQGAAKFQERKNNININFLVRISRGHSWPFYARMPRGQKVSPHHPGCRKMHFLVRTSTVFGVDVHDPKGSQKTLYRKSLRWFSCP